MMRRRVSIPALLGALAITACASGGSAPAAELDPTYDFTRVRTVYVETPVQVTVPGSSGVGNTQIAETAERRLREYLRAERGWTVAGTAAGADLTVRLQITQWEPGSTGSRVGAVLELVRPTGGRVLRSADVFPSRFGTPAPGSPTDLMDPLLDQLLGDLP